MNKKILTKKIKVAVGVLDTLKKTKTTGKKGPATIFTQSFEFNLTEAASLNEQYLKIIQSVKKKIKVLDNDLKKAKTQIKINAAKTKASKKTIGKSTAKVQKNVIKKAGSVVSKSKKNNNSAAKKKSKVSLIKKKK
ncbi:MAG: hypothetical protein V2A54_17770 [Bacteroidota bacterium]